MIDSLIANTDWVRWVCPERTTPGAPAADAEHSRIEICVIFTDSTGTLAALHKADRLARNLGARLRLLWPYEVPYMVSLTNPPVAVEFLEGQLRALASSVPMDTAGHIILCRDKRRTLHLILKPGSIVVLGGGKLWWSKEQKLARDLKKSGHQVIFANAE